MVVALAWTFLVVVLAIVACVVAYAERRARPLPYWRLLPLPLLIAAATVVLFYVPPSNDLGDPAVWMAALVSGVVGVARGAWVGLEVDHQQRRFLLRRAPEAFWIALAATLLIAADILAEPVGRLDFVLRPDGRARPHGPHELPGRPQRGTAGQEPRYPPARPVSEPGTR